MSDENEQQPETVGKTDQEAQEAIRREEVERDEPESMTVDTAYVIFAQDGVGFGVASVDDIYVNLDGKRVKVEPLRKATPDDMYRYAMEIAKDIQVSATATATVQQMAIFTQQMQRQMQDQKIAQQVAGKGGGPGGLHIPR